MEVFVASIEYSQVRKGMVIVGDDNQLYLVVDRDLNTPGNWRAILQLKLKNLKTGSIINNRVRPQDKVEQAYLDRREMQYIYQDGDGYVFMDSETYDQITLGKEWVGDLMLYEGRQQGPRGLLRGQADQSRLAGDGRPAN